MDRRDFVRSGLAAASLAWGAPRLVAAAPGTPRLLVVFLRGAYDAASLLVPLGNPFYREQRPTIAIPEPGSGPDAALPLDRDWGLHPALAGSIGPLYRQGQVAFVPFAGSDDVSRSHFETQDAIELGQASTGPRDFQSGWLNRLAEVIGARSSLDVPTASDASIGSLAPIAFTDRLPLVFRGPVPVPNLVLSSVGRGRPDARQAGLIASMYRDRPLAGAVEEGFAVRERAARDIAGSASPAAGGAMTREPSAERARSAPIGEMVAANRNAIDARGFEGEARRIARLMRDRHHLGFVDVGGWDTHVGQGAATGYLANRFAELGQGLAGFVDEMGAAWRETTVVVVSEFGRTFRENGNRGTDHGHGSVWWVLGGGLRGGRVLGEQVAVGPSTLFQDRDYPVLNEYRAWVGGLLGRLYGLGAGDRARIFAGIDSRDLGLL